MHKFTLIEKKTDCSAKTCREYAIDFINEYKHLLANGHQEARKFMTAYTSLVSLINSEINKLICSGEMVKLPLRLGSLYVGKSKARPINWGETRKKRLSENNDGRIVKFMNFHTDGEFYKFSWYKAGSSALFRNKEIFVFKPVRANKTFLAKSVKTRYIEFRPINLRIKKSLWNLYHLNQS